MSIVGRLTYQFWHRPLGAMRESIRHGGPINQARVRRGQKEMQAAALQLPPIKSSKVTTSPFKAHLLTGRKFAYQTGFCLRSLADHITDSLEPELYDDGSLTNRDYDFFHRLLPKVKIHGHDELSERLVTLLPVTQFPTLRERWINYPHIRKIIDVHLGRQGWRLVMDSDLLFWRRPDLLLDWQVNPHGPIHAVDCKESYGYPRELLAQLAGTQIPPLVNVGLLGLKSEEIDWAFLEHSATHLINTHGTSYYLEQALGAMIIARSKTSPMIAPEADYITFPSSAELQNPTAVMHHYVDTTRDYYHLQAWRRILSTPLITKTRLT